MAARSGIGSLAVASRNYITSILAHFEECASVGETVVETRGQGAAPVNSEAAAATARHTQTTTTLFI